MAAAADEEDEAAATLLAKHYPAIKFFVTRGANFQDFDRGRMPTKLLIQKSIEHFAEDDENCGSGEIDKYVIVDAIYRMKKEGLVRSTRVDGGQMAVYLSALGGGGGGDGLRRGSGSGRGGSADTELRLTQDLRCSQEGGESQCHLSHSNEQERSKDNQESPAGTNDEQDGDGCQEEPELERSDSEDSFQSLAQVNASPSAVEARRHAEAYAEMTRDAIPLLPTPDEHSSPIRTPSRKRKRVMEISAHDSWSSINNMTSPGYANSTPRRSHNCILQKQSDSRRNRIVLSSSSPLRRNSPTRTLKQEATDACPAWLLGMIEKLRLKYPHGAFQPEDESIRCLDCEDKVISLGPHRRLNNFENHLRSKGHKANVTKRLEKVGESALSIVSSNNSIGSYTPSELPLARPQQPLHVFAQHQNFEALQQQYFEAVRNTDQNKALRATLVETRLTKLEKEHAEKFQLMMESIEATNQQVREHQGHMTEMLCSLEQTAQNHTGILAGRLNSFEVKSHDDLNRMNDTVETFRNVVNVRLDDMITRLARSDYQHNDQTERLTHNLKTFKQHMTEELETILQKLNTLIVEKTGPEKLCKDLEATNQEQNKVLWARIRQVEQEDLQQSEMFTKTLDSCRLLSQESVTVRAHEISLAEKLQDVEQRYKLQQNECVRQCKALAEAQQRLIGAHESQQGDMDDLRLECQVHKDELSRQRETNDFFKHMIVQQMQAHIELTDKKVKKIEQECAARIETAERENIDRIKEVERKSSESINTLAREHSKRIRELEKAMCSHRQSIIRYDKVIPVIMDDSARLRRDVEDLKADLDSDLGDLESSQSFCMEPQASN